MHETPKFNNQVKNRFIIQIMGDKDIYMPCRFPSGEKIEHLFFKTKKILEGKTEPYKRTAIIELLVMSLLELLGT